MNTRQFLSLSVVCAALLLASHSFSEPVQPGKRYTGEAKIEVPTFNVEFTVPKGWVGALNPGSNFFEIGKDNQMGRVFVWGSKASKSEVMASMRQGFPVAGAVMLTPKGEPKTSGSVITGDFTATDGTNQYEAYVRAMPHKSGVAVAVIAVAPPAKIAEFKKLATTVQKSVKFKKPKNVSGAKSSGPWAQRLGNTRYIRYQHGSDYSEKEIYDLCANGRFYHRLNVSSSGPLGPGGMDEGARGRWSVSGDRLTLTFDNGNSSTVTIAERGGSFYVDGQKWYRKPNPCR